MLKLLLPEAPLWALVVRGVVVYLFLVAALRLSGRRELAQMTSFDLVLLLLVSNAVQNSLNAGDNSLVGGLVSAATLFLLNRTVGYAVWRWRWLDRLVQGRPLRLVTDGRVHTGALRKEQLTLAELRSALRKQGISRIGDCQRVVLEPDGTLTAVRTGLVVRPVTELAHPDPFYRAGPAVAPGPLGG
jgi:uncharacterized membrane protein YcaP (DUF421 family)